MLLKIKILKFSKIKFQINKMIIYFYDKNYFVIYKNQTKNKIKILYSNQKYNLKNVKNIIYKLIKKIY